MAQPKGEDKASYIVLQTTKIFKKMMVQTISIKNLVKNNNPVKFDSYRQGFFYYNVGLDESQEDNYQGYITTTKYQFPIPLDDVGTATLLKEDKAITYMRWIRKAIEDGTLIQIS